jgi:pimeloyl-ACP methyl ester carboxylesterase
MLCVLAASPAAAEQPACEAVKVPVALGPESAATGDVIFGELCQRAGARPNTVVVLVHGFTYNHLYWDFPYRPERYSQVRSLTHAGYATFAYDQIDAGQSSKPLSTRVTTEREADVLHQLVAGLQVGRLDEPGPDELRFHPFQKVVTEGHSSGSIVAITEAATYRDVDGVIGTGVAAHNADSVSLAEAIPQGVRPAILDPKFADSGLDPGYLTSTPAFYDFMHDPDDVDPEVVRRDEANRDTASATGEATLASALSESTPRVVAPLFLAQGGRDRLFCGPTGECTEESVREAEQPFYPNVASFDVFVLPSAGHSMNLALNAGDWYAAAVDWLDRTIR